MNMRLSEIKISADFESSTPNASKYEKCEKYYDETGNQDRYIVIDENNVLVDGYIMYLVLKSHDAGYAKVKRLTLRKHKYTDRQRNKCGKLVPSEKVISYKDKPTVYIYGKHQNGIINKEYVWRLPKSKENMYGILLPGDLIYCSTKNGIAPVIVTRIEKRDLWDTELNIKVVCSRKIIRNGELLTYDNKDGSDNV
jgi:hypothetical protein